MVMKVIEEDHQGAPVSRDTMVKIIQGCAHEYTSNLIESLDSDFIPSLKEIWETILREREPGEPRFIAGDWVEFLDDDMNWKLGKVAKAAFREVEDMGAQGQMIHYGLDDGETEYSEVSPSFGKRSCLSVFLFQNSWTFRN